MCGSLYAYAGLDLSFDRNDAVRGRRPKIEPAASR